MCECPIGIRPSEQHNRALSGPRIPGGNRSRGPVGGRKDRGLTIPWPPAMFVIGGLCLLVQQLHGPAPGRGAGDEAMTQTHSREDRPLVKNQGL